MLQHTMAEWFPTSEDHKKAFDEALRDKRWLGSKLEHWIESFNRRGEQPPDLTDVLRLWVSTPPTEDEFELSVTLTALGKPKEFVFSSRVSAGTHRCWRSGAERRLL
jgi:hypothetical protein